MYGLGYIGYHIGIGLYAFVVRVAALFNDKAALFVKGRKGLINRMQQDLANEQRKKIWFHCASLGEFEQARPIIETIKKEYPDFAIIITFFSPSGYEIRKNYALADYCYYLPIDTKRNAQRVIQWLNPTAVFFVKYEVWYYYLKTLKQKSIPTFLVSANFRQNHIYFKWYGTFFRNMLQWFSHIFCQNEISAQRLAFIGCKHVSVSKDTRFDRVYEHAMMVKKIEQIEWFVEGKKILVAGSSYAAEEQLIAQAFSNHTNWKLIIAPHHIEPERIEAIEKQFAAYGSIRFSEITDPTSLKGKRVLITDNIGMLSSVYSYANCAVIGGGFGKSGLHNMLEAVTFGMPILIGPNNLQKFPESLDMIKEGICTVIGSSDDLQLAINDWEQHPEVMAGIANHAKQWVKAHTGATQHIMKLVRPVLE